MLLGWMEHSLTGRLGEKSFEHKLPVCFLCLEKSSVHSPSRGILWQEMSFVSQKLEITRAGGVMLKKMPQPARRESQQRERLLFLVTKTPVTAARTPLITQ